MRRLLLRGLGAALLLLLLAAGWTGYRAVQARRHLEAARTAAAALERDLLAGDRATVGRQIADIGRATARARALTSDPVWGALSRVPLAGNSLRTAGGLADAADVLAREALPELDRAAGQLALDRLRTRPDTVALGPIEQAHPALARASAAVDRAVATVAGLPRSYVAGPVGRARADFARQLDRISGTAADAARATRLAPAMLGRDGPRRYLLAILTNAEMRGSGGLLGGYGVLEADRGRLRLLKLGTNSELPDSPVPAIDLGADHVNRYRRFGGDSAWVNANMSPHFPYASRVWLALWARSHGGQRLDGTIAVDPVTLAGVLRVTGPVAVPARGLTVGTDNVVALTERDAYARYTDSRLRDAVLLDVARAVYAKLTTARADNRALLSALASSAGTRHLQVASAHPAEQAVLEQVPLGGALPAAPGPYLEVLTQNAGGNKLDYYLRREVTYRTGRDGDAEVVVRLRNTAPRGLPSYVVSRLDRPGAKPTTPGQARTYLSVYAGVGAGLLGAALDGRPLAMESERELGHGVFSTFLDVDPGKVVELRLRIREPRSGVVVWREPPLVVPDLRHRRS